MIDFQSNQISSEVDFHFCSKENSIISMYFFLEKGLLEEHSPSLSIFWNFVFAPLSMMAITWQPQTQLNLQMYYTKRKQ